MSLQFVLGEESDVRELAGLPQLTPGTLWTGSCSTINRIVYQQVYKMTNMTGVNPIFMELYDNWMH